MSKRAAYFADGTIIECECGKSAFKRHILVHKKYSDGNDQRVWFRPCDAWHDATKKSFDAWARQHGFASYDGYSFIKSVFAKDGDGEWY